MQAVDSILRCQRILAQMLKGLRPVQMPELVGQVARVYTFLYRSVYVCSWLGGLITRRLHYDSPPVSVRVGPQ